MTAEGIIQPTARRGSYEVCSPSAVPRSRDTIQPLISAAVDVFWQCRRYGEPWDEVTPPQSYMDASDDTNDDQAGVCALSRRVHRRLVFDLVAEILRDIYNDDDAADASPPYDDRWLRRRPPPRRPRHFAVMQPLPTTVDCVKPLVERHVFACLGLAHADELYAAAAATTTASKKRGVDRRMRDDAVDRMLVEELSLEEAGWVDYDDDMTTRKQQLSSWLQEALLADTIYAVDNAIHRRQHVLASLSNNNCHV